MSAYTPRPGSNAEKLLDNLAANGPATTTALADACDVDWSSINGSLSTALRYEAVAHTPHRGVYVWHLPDQSLDDVRGLDESAQQAPAAAEPERPAATAKAAKAAKPRQKAKRNGAAKPQRVQRVPCVIAEPQTAGRMAVADDGTILILDGDRIAHRISAEQALQIATLVGRLARAAN